MLKQIISVVTKDFLIEWRNKFTIAGIFIQVLASVFIVYMAIPALNIAIQNSLFWIVLIFSSLNAITKGFIAESLSLQNFLKQLIPSNVIIKAKLIYNFILVSAITIIIWLFFILFLGDFNSNNFTYLLIVLLSNIGISSTFTLMSALVRQISNAFLIIPVISLPISIPILIIGLNASKKAMDGAVFSSLQKEILLLSSISIFATIMSIVLFTILDKD